MTIVPTIWVDDNDEPYQRQHDTFIYMVKKYEVDNIDGVSLGNEVFFRKEVSPEELFGRIADVRQEIQWDLKKKVPVYTLDLGSNVDAVQMISCGTIGWPTAGASESAAVTSIPNLQTFLNTFICDANKLNTNIIILKLLILLGRKNLDQIRRKLWYFL
ncbi:2593_t:CDS:2 [Funneliformis geosporum]|uniref:glucan endo-1,3-beta-D-glucosidase n=1 Tax=Funneliformis geosporum TaxID=1117311 RepID=A0A9W4SH36_9GLOM|nr:14481_t:CDS:2 [Funneliformis geosporum]CAI2172671.1 2593_t:CDS:2 [Funneliformis geosporum]